MPGFLTSFANNKVLDVLFGGQAVSPPSTYYVGLALVPANRSGSYYEVPTMSSDTTPVPTGYARVAITNSLTNFPAATGGLKLNTMTITFPAPVKDWGTVYSLFFADASTGGNIWLMSDLAVPRLVLNGSTAPVIAAGAAVLQDS